MTVTLISKTSSPFSSKELELLGLLYGLFQQFISFDQRLVQANLFTSPFNDSSFASLKGAGMVQW